MRGKVSPGSSERRACGITPAHAGKSREVLINVPGSGDHPRVCGEKDQVKSMSTEDVGSPPRMRGKESLHTPTCRNTGITPAYAGKSKRSGALSRGQKDHPRVCGEKSSNVHGGGMFPWITPAYAGKSRQRRRRGRRRQDHPRVCGEKCVVEDFIAPPAGSPPRMRGKARKGAL